MSSLRDDDVSIALARLDELEIHRLDGLGVPLDHGLHRLSPFENIPCHDSHQSVVVIGVNEYLDVHLVP